MKPIDAMTPRNFRLLLATSCSAMALLASIPASAASVGAVSSVALDGAAPTLLVDPSGFPPVGSGGSVDVLDYEFGSGGSNALTHSYGSSGGSFGSRSSGTGNYIVSSSFSYTDTITNTGVGTVDALLTFHVTAGQVDAVADAVGSSASSDFKITIATLGSGGGVVAATEIERSVADGTVTSFLSSSGTAIDLLESDDGSGVSWGERAFTIDLGAIAAGASLSFNYLMETSATGITPVGTFTRTVCDGYGGYGGYGPFLTDLGLSTVFDGGYGGYGEGCSSTHEETYSGLLNPAASSIARSGDPLNIDPTSGPDSTTNPLDPDFNGAALVTSVPEPASAALLGVGLVGLALLRRRQGAVAAASIGADW